jgi:uncharacterized protein
LRAVRHLLFIMILGTLLIGCRDAPAERAAIDSSPTPVEISIAPSAPAESPVGAPAATPRGTVTPPMQATALPTASPVMTATPAPTVALQPTATPPPTLTLQPTATPPPTVTPQPSPTPDPYAGLSIDALRQETYGLEGSITIVETMEQQPGFTRYRISFPSDGLQVGGFMNVPAGEGPFPVVIVNHGYMPPASYETLTYTTKYADALASAGLLAIHPNFRNHRGSDYGDNPFRIGYARDVLHLIPMAQRLPQATGGKVGLWGHSMGGGVTLRALTVTDQVAAAVVYGSMSGDEAKNYDAIMRWTGGAASRTGALPIAPAADPSLYRVISPLNYLDYVTATVAIHHGVLDEQVPFAWSEELAGRLEEAGVPYAFYAYPGQPHNFTGEGYNLLNERVISFFEEHLK